MATFKETREILLASYASNIITIEEYALLFEENSSNNLDFPYYNYPLFNLESQSEAECRAKLQSGKAPHSSGRGCSSNSALLRMRPGNGLRRNRRGLHDSEAVFLSVSILRHDTYFWKASTGTLHDMQHRNRLDLCTSWAQNHAMEPNHFKSTRAGKVRGSCF